MDFDDIRNYFLIQKNAEETTPFGPNTLVYKIGGKMFGLLAFDGELISLNLKNTPEVNLELREDYFYIIPGYHMSKKHWNTIKVIDGIDKKLLHRMIDQSYAIVLNSLPKKIASSLS